MHVVDLYLRKSTKDEGRSVARQEAELTDGAGRHDLTVGRVFVDPDFSASRYRRRERPDYAALLEHIRDGGREVLGIFEASRGSRDLTEWSAFLDLCRKHKVKIWVSSHDHVYDLSRRRDWRALADEGVDAADESEKISERVLSGKRRAAREGKPAGRTQYGFLREYDERGNFVRQSAHPTEGPIVAEMVGRVAAGETLFAIARELNERGITMPGGQPWAGRFVRQMVMRPAYVGRRVHHGVDVGPAAWEPIVDVDKWHTAVAILTRPERRSTTRGTALRHWLTGAMSCGACTSGRLRAMTAGPRQPGRIRYMCPACNGLYVAAGPVEKAVESIVLERLRQPDALDLFRPRIDSANVAAAEDTLRTLRDRLQAHYAEAAQGTLSAAGLAAVEGMLLPEIERAIERVKRLTLPPVLAELAGVDVAARWTGMSATTRRNVVRAVAEVVVMPASRRGPGLDVWRLERSRWLGDSKTWGDHWRESGLG